MLRQHTGATSIDAAVVQTAIAAAQARARGLRRSLRAQAADEEDFRQAFLLDLICRADRFDASRGTWPAFVCVVTHNAAARLARKQIRLSASTTPLAPEQDIADERYRVSAADMVVDFRRAVRRLPRRLQSVVARIAETGHLAGAQRASDMSPASFYRAVRDLRLRLIAEGASLNKAAHSARTADRTCGSIT